MIIKTPGSFLIPKILTNPYYAQRAVQKQFENFSKPYFDKGKAWDFKTIERNIYISKNKEVVWFDELLDTWMGTCRGSGVLEKNNTEWKIKQYVLSVTIPNDSIQKVIKLKN